jgi:precorrin-6A synthase
MRTVKVIGVGMGELEHLTGQALVALNSVDVFLVLEKGTDDDLAQVRRELCQRAIPSRSYRFVELEDPRRDRAADDYGRAVTDWTAARASVVGRAIRDELGEDGCAGLLAWGDPAFYDSTLRVLASAATPEAPFRVEVVPGLSSIQLLAAAHRVSLTRVGSPLQVTTGRRLAADGFPPGCDDVVVMLDGDTAFRHIDPAGMTIYWGAHLASAYETLVAGDLRTVAGEIVERRAEAKARRGWVMDTYLLRRERAAGRADDLPGPPRPIRMEPPTTTSTATGSTWSSATATPYGPRSA